MNKPWQEQLNVIQRKHDKGLQLESETSATYDNKNCLIEYRQNDSLELTNSDEVEQINKLSTFGIRITKPIQTVYYQLDDCYHKIMCMKLATNNSYSIIIVVQESA